MSRFVGKEGWDDSAYCRRTIGFVRRCCRNISEGKAYQLKNNSTNTSAANCHIEEDATALWAGC